MSDKSYKILVIAPHLAFPIKKGADILISKRTESLINAFSEVTIISLDRIKSYKNGKLLSEKSFNNKPRFLIFAALFSLLSGKSYLYGKFYTNKYNRILQNYLKKNGYHLIYHSFIYSAANKKIKKATETIPVRIIETHNNDIEWYSNIFRTSNNFFIKITALQSLFFTKRFLKNNKKDFKFIVLTSKDKLGYAQYLSSTDMWQIPVGIDIPNNTISLQQNCSDINLLFIGSLNVKMNYDALLHFKNVYYPELHARYKDRLRINIAGRQPSKKIIKLCETNNWNLFANISDLDLQKLYLHTNFTLLPFPYTTGSKLKMLESFSYGVPVLATEIMKEQINLENFSQYGIFSDSSTEWKDYIDRHLYDRFNPTIRKRIENIAFNYKWETINKKLINNIKLELGRK